MEYILKRLFFSDNRRPLQAFMVEFDSILDQSCLMENYLDTIWQGWQLTLKLH